MIRLFFVLVVAALEATVVSLPLAALTTGVPAWPLLFGAVVLGWLADQVALRLPKRLDRPALLAGALVAAALVIGGELRLGPLAALGALLSGPNVLQAYVLLILALFLYWRGTRLDTRDSAGVGALFSWGATAGVVGLLLGAVSGTGLPLGSPTILGQIVALIGLGLLALSLAHAQEVAGGRLSGLSWRWLLTLLAAVGGVIALALVAVSLLGQGEAATAAQGLIRLLLLPLAIVGGAIAWLLITLFAEPLSALVAAILARLQGIQAMEVPDEAYTDQEGAAAVAERITQLANGATFLMALIPIAILIVAILVLRRRRHPQSRADEERESLGVLSNLAGDLRDLLGGLRNPFARPLEGLRAALAALSGDDPTSRARRAYVRLLLLLEGRERRRPLADTPAEFAPAAAAAAGAEEPVAQLTAAYEQARYNPAGATPAAADEAEAALRGLERPR